MTPLAICFVGVLLIWMLDDRLTHICNQLTRIANALHHKHDLAPEEDGES